MHRYLTGLAVALAVVTVSAPAVAAPPRSAAEASRQVNSWMKALAEWNAPYDALASEQAELIATVGEGITEARRYAEARDFNGGRSWARGWADSHRAKLVEFRTRLTALPKSPPALTGPGWDLATLPEARNTLSMFTATPRLSDQELTYNEKLIGQALTIIEAAAGGNESAIRNLQPLYFDLHAANLTANNRLNAVFLPVLDREHSPKASAFRAAIAANESVITSYKLIRAKLVSEPTDLPAATAALRQNADQIDAAVREMSVRARSLNRLGAVGELDRKFDALVVSYDQTGVVLTDLAGRIRSLADVYAAGRELDLDRTIDALQAMGPSMDRFFELEHERAALLRQ